MGQENRALIQTQWIRSPGLYAGDEIYFLSYYRLYLPGKVIIPMFAVTNPKYFYRDLSLYKLTVESVNTRGSLERVWSLGSETGNRKMNLQSCRFGRLGEKLYYSWTGSWNADLKQSLHPVLECDIENDTYRLMDEVEAPVALDYQHPDKISASKVWSLAGILPLDEWSLPSPLEYSSTQPRFLAKTVVQRLADREFRFAALEKLDEMGNPKVFKNMLSQMEKNLRDTTKLGYGTYYEKWTLLIEMSDTLRESRPRDIFSAAFENDTELLRQFIDTGVDPNTQDSRGRTPLMYAVMGKAPDTLRMLFELGADPTLENNSGTTVWHYAALNPLRHLYLELWER